MADFVIVAARVHLIVPDDIIVADALHAIHLIFVSELKSSDRSLPYDPRKTTLVIR